MTKLRELKARFIEDPEFRKKCPRIDEEDALIEALVRARKAAKLTQVDLAQCLDTTHSTVAQLEGGEMSPLLATLRRYAEAAGMRLTVGFERTDGFKDRLLAAAHPSWQSVLHDALGQLDTCFMECLRCCASYWLPGPEKCLAAFTVPKEKVRVVWLGESPYPRRASATGLSFQDGSVDELFRCDGRLSKNVNKATSLRAILKAWFVATGRLDPRKTSTNNIQEMSKGGLISKLPELFERGQEGGWMWLNAGLSLFPTGDEKDKRIQINEWKPFVEHVLQRLMEEAEPPTCVLAGDFARSFGNLGGSKVISPVHPRLEKEFINDQAIRKFLDDWRCLIELGSPAQP